MADVSMCGFERRTSVPDALGVLEHHAHALGAERVPVTEAAGRVAAKSLIATVDVPHFPRAMMDGYAVVAESTFGATEQAPHELVVSGEVRAGRDVHHLRVTTESVVRVTTGSEVPPGADAVLMAEDTRPLASRGGTERIGITAPVAPSKHIGQVGEDIRQGDALIQRGRHLRPQDAGVLASAGVAQVDVVMRPRVHLLITGDELLPPGEAPRGSQIADSNSVVLRALVERDGGLIHETQHVQDDFAATRQALEASGGDVILVSGGSSVGPEDHAPKVLDAIGTVLVHGVAMRPSSPAGFGFLSIANQKRLVFLLPGNPVSCLCAYEFFAGPVIRVLGGRDWGWPHPQKSMPAASKFVSVLGRTDYTRVTVDERGATPLMTSGASILSSTTRADGFVIVPEGREGYAVGEPVDVLMY